MDLLRQKKLEALLNEGGWHCWPDITKITGVKRSDIIHSKFFLEGYVVGSVKGVKLTRYATPSERKDAINELKSRAKAILSRAEAIEKLANRISPSYTQTPVADPLPP